MYKNEKIYYIFTQTKTKGIKFLCGANPKTSGKLAKLAASRRRRGASFSEFSRHYECSFFEVFGSFPMDKLTAILISNNPRQD